MVYADDWPACKAPVMRLFERLKAVCGDRTMHITVIRERNMRQRISIKINRREFSWAQVPSIARIDTS